MKRICVTSINQLKLNANNKIYPYIIMDRDRAISIMLSILLGLASAYIFRQTCKNGRCVVISSPTPEIIEKKIYRKNGKCYKVEKNPCP